MPIINSVVIGFALSLLGGGLVVWLFLLISRKLTGLGDKPQLGSRRVPPWLTGVVERLFFTTLVGLGVQGAAPAAIGWLALKLATNWNHPDWKDKPEARSHALLALLAGLLSLLIAVVGGLIASNAIKIGI